jgi:hypothetical protein
MAFIGLSRVWNISQSPCNSISSPTKKFLLALSLTLVFLNAAFAQRMYDGSGHQIGRVDGERYYDGSGHQIGRVDGDRIYDGSEQQGIAVRVTSNANPIYDFELRNRASKG